MQDQTVLIDCNEVARRIGVSASFARRLAHRGEFGDVFDVSGPGALHAAVRVSQAGVDAWLTRRRYPSTRTG